MLDLTLVSVPFPWITVYCRILLFFPCIDLFPTLLSFQTAILIGPHASLSYFPSHIMSSLLFHPPFVPHFHSFPEVSLTSCRPSLPLLESSSQFLLKSSLHLASHSSLHPALNPHPSPQTPSLVNRARKLETWAPHSVLPQSSELGPLIWPACASVSPFLALHYSCGGSVTHVSDVP